MWRIVKILSVFGILLAVFLLWEQFFHPAFQPCNVSSIVNCNAVISGAVAKTLGIPTPLIGLTGYVIILLASLWKKKKTVVGMAAFGLAFCLWIAYQELFLLHTICPVCILCQLDMISVFIMSLFLLRKTYVKK